MFDQQHAFLSDLGEYFYKKVGQYLCQGGGARHGVPVLVVSDRDIQFTSRFWMQFHDEMGTRLHFSNAFHPQNDD